MVRFERIVGGEGPPRLVGVKRIPRRPSGLPPARVPEPALRRARTDHGEEAPAARPEVRHVRPASYVLVSLLLSALFFGIFFVSDRGLLRVRRQREQLAKAHEEIAELEAGNRRLEAEVAAMKTDPRALEKIGREQLNLVKPGEVVLVLPDGWEKRVKPAAPAATPMPPLGNSGEVPRDLSRVLRGRDGLVDLRDLPLRVDQERLPLRDAEREVDAVALDDLAVLVCEEAEGQPVLLCEFLLYRDGILRHAENDDVFRELRAFVTEGLRLDRSTGRVGLREEVEDDALACEGGERDRLPVLVLQREVRSGVARLEGGSGEKCHALLAGL